MLVDYLIHNNRYPVTRFTCHVPLQIMIFEKGMDTTKMRMA